jgi:hypothetical protein
MNRPRPVLLYGAVVAALQAVLSMADLSNLVPEKVIAILNMVLIILLAVGGALFVQGQVTPLSDPQASDGRKLVPSPPAEVPPGTPVARLDATEDDPGPRTGPRTGTTSIHDDGREPPYRWSDRRELKTDRSDDPGREISGVVCVARGVRVWVR